MLRKEGVGSGGGGGWGWGWGCFIGTDGYQEQKSGGFGRRTRAVRLGGMSRAQRHKECTPPSRSGDLGPRAQEN